MLNTDPISNRAISAFAVSVGTSLALESIFTGPNPCIDPEREIPQQIDINKYDEFYINISTLFRNLMGSLNKDDSYKITSDALRDALIYEMELIDSIFKNEGNSRVKVIFYINNYKDALSILKHPYASYRIQTTDSQKIYKKFHDETLSKLVKNTQENNNFKIFNSEVKPLIKCKALILSHIAYDLLSHKYFDLLDLIESHTGVLKPKSTWYTKFYNGKELNFIPFNLGFLQIFGDSFFYKPFDIKIRRTIIEMAKNNGWSQITTMPKIIQNIDLMTDHLSREIIKSVLRE
jgi:hypothetical protein